MNVAHMYTTQNKYYSYVRLIFFIAQCMCVYSADRCLSVRQTPFVTQSRTSQWNGGNSVDADYRRVLQYSWWRPEVLLG